MIPSIQTSGNNIPNQCSFPDPKHGAKDEATRKIAGIVEVLQSVQTPNQYSYTLRKIELLSHDIGRARSESEIMQNMVKIIDIAADVLSHANAEETTEVADEDLKIQLRLRTQSKNNPADICNLFCDALQKLTTEKNYDTAFMLLASEISYRSIGQSANQNRFSGLFGSLLENMIADSIASGLPLSASEHFIKLIGLIEEKNKEYRSERHLITLSLTNTIEKVLNDHLAPADKKRTNDHFVKTIDRFKEIISATRNLYISSMTENLLFQFSGQLKFEDLDLIECLSSLPQPHDSAASERISFFMRAKMAEQEINRLGSNAKNQLMNLLNILQKYKICDRTSESIDFSWLLFPSLQTSVDRLIYSSGFNYEKFVNDIKEMKINPDDTHILCAIYLAIGIRIVITSNREPQNQFNEHCESLIDKINQLAHAQARTFLSNLFHIEKGIKELEFNGKEALKQLEEAMTKVACTDSRHHEQLFELVIHRMTSSMTDPLLYRYKTDGSKAVNHVLERLKLVLGFEKDEIKNLLFPHMLHLAIYNRLLPIEDRGATLNVFSTKFDFTSSKDLAALLLDYLYPELVNPYNLHSNPINTETVKTVLDFMAKFKMTAPADHFVDVQGSYGSDEREFGEFKDGSLIKYLAAHLIRLEPATFLEMAKEIDTPAFKELLLPSILNELYRDWDNYKRNQTNTNDEAEALLFSLDLKTLEHPAKASLLKILLEKLIIQGNFADLAAKLTEFDLDDPTQEEICRCVKTEIEHTTDQLLNRSWGHGPSNSELPDFIAKLLEVDDNDQKFITLAFPVIINKLINALPNGLSDGNRDFAKDLNNIQKLAAKFKNEEASKEVKASLKLMHEAAEFEKIRGIIRAKRWNDLEPYFNNNIYFHEPTTDDSNFELFGEIMGTLFQPASGETEPTFETPEAEFSWSLDRLANQLEQFYPPLRNYIINVLIHILKNNSTQIPTEEVDKIHFINLQIDKCTTLKMKFEEKDKATAKDAPPAANAPMPADEAPAAPSAAQAASSAAPAGSSVAPAGSSVAPAGSSVAPAGSSVAPAGSSVAPARAPAAARAARPVPAAKPTSRLENASGYVASLWKRSYLFKGLTFFSLGIIPLLTWIGALLANLKAPIQK